MSKKLYVLGVALLPDNGAVLVLKNRPQWQAGKWNFVGGKIETIDGVEEEPLVAMQREFHEEAGIDYKNWKRCGTLHGVDWTVFLFSARDEIFKTAQTATDETIFPFSSGQINCLYEKGSLLKDVNSIYHFARENFEHDTNLEMHFS